MYTLLSFIEIKALHARCVNEARVHHTGTTAPLCLGFCSILQWLYTHAWWWWLWQPGHHNTVTWFFFLTKARRKCGIYILYILLNCVESLLSILIIIRKPFTLNHFLLSLLCFTMVYSSGLFCDTTYFTN